LGSFGIFLFHLIEISFLRRKSTQPLKAVEKRKQNSKNKRQNSEDGKHKSHNHKKLLKKQSEKEKSSSARGRNNPPHNWGNLRV
jgi:hypothetical protein